MVKQKRYRRVVKIPVSSLPEPDSGPTRQPDRQPSRHVGFADLNDDLSLSSNGSTTNNEKRGDGVKFASDVVGGDGDDQQIESTPFIENMPTGPLTQGLDQPSQTSSNNNSIAGSSISVPSGQYKYAIPHSDSKTPVEQKKDDDKKKEEEEEEKEKNEKEEKERKTEAEHRRLSILEQQRVAPQQRSRGSILAVKENFKSYITNQSMKRGSLAFVANIDRTESDIQTLDKFVAEHEEGEVDSKYQVLEKPDFMTPKIAQKPKPTPRKTSVFRRMSNVIFGSPEKNQPQKLTPVETEMNKIELDGSGRISPTIEECDEEDEDRKEQDKKDLAFLNQDNDGPVTVEELDGREEKKDNGTEVPETTGSPPRKDSEELERTASENSSHNDSDADSEKDEEAEAEKGQTLAERKKLRRQKEKLKEEEGKGATKEEEKDLGLSRKEMKRQNKARRRLASVHAIPNLGEVVEEVVEIKSVEEIMAEQKDKDNEQLAAADRMKAENEAFLRKLRGEDNDENGSVDSQGRELSETVVDTITGSNLFKFERYFLYLQFTSVILSLNVPWPDAFEYSFGIFAWLSNEWYVWTFHKFFSLFRIPELVDIVDLAMYYWLVNYALKLVFVVVLLWVFFNFWVIKDYTDPKFTDAWIQVYIKYWWNLVLFWKSGFARCIFATALLESVVVGLGVLLWVTLDKDRGVALMVSGTLFLAVFFTLYLIFVCLTRLAFYRKTRNNEYYTMRIMMKNIVETKNRICLFLLSALYLPTLLTIFKAVIPIYDWNDTHAPLPRTDQIHRTIYENSFIGYSNANHGLNTLTNQINYHVSCYIMGFPPNVSPDTNKTVATVECNSPTGYSITSATSLLLPVYAIGFPLMCLYLAVVSYQTMKASNWFPNYVAQYQSYTNYNRHLRKESKLIFRFKIKALIFLQELAKGMKADMIGVIKIILFQEAKQISKAEERRRRRRPRRPGEKQGLVGGFSTFIYIMIFANLGVMGHEREIWKMGFLDNPPDEDGVVTPNAELIALTNLFFAAVFFYEFVVKILGMAPKFYFRDPFNIFDFFLVLFSVLEIFILPLIFPEEPEGDDDAAGEDGDGGGGSGAGGAKAVRLFKMARLLKMLRLGKIVKALKLKVNRHLKRVEEMYNADDYDWPQWRRKLKKKVIGKLVTNFIYVLIFINLAGVFAGDDLKAADPEMGYPIMYYSDWFFGVAFSIEMLVKWVGIGPKLYFMDPFEILNFVLVLMGWGELIFLPPDSAPPEEDISGDGGGAGAAKLARLARFARFARFARVLRLLKIFKPQSQAQWRFQKSLEFKITKLNGKFVSACEEYISTCKAFAVDHELVILSWDSLLDASSTIYLIQPFKHNMRYWKSVHHLETLVFSAIAVVSQRNHGPIEQLQMLVAVLVVFQTLHLIVMPYLYSRERKLDFFCRTALIWNCLVGIMIVNELVDEIGSGLLMMWGNLSLLFIFGFLMQVPQMLKRMVKGLRDRVDSGVVKFVFKQITKKNLALENINTGLLALQQWDNMIQDEKWMGFVGLSKTKPKNLLNSRQRFRYVKWAALRDLKLINIRDPIGVSVLHEAMARAEPEICRWLVHHDREFVDLEDDGRDTPMLIGLKECSRALLSFAEKATEEMSWKRSRYADIFLSEQIHSSNPHWNRFHYATLEDMAVPLLGELTQQLATCFDLNPPEGYVRVSKWYEYGDSVMEFLAEMYVASRRELLLYNKELGDIGFDSFIAMTRKMSVKHTSFTVPTNYKLFYPINVVKLDLRTNRLKHEAGIAIASMLETNSTLQILDLSDNAIDDEAGISIMEALRHNHAVHTLKMSKNLLGPGTGKELAHCLRRNQVLREVDMSWNSMGAKRFWKDLETEEFVTGSGEELGMSLRHNKTLTVLNLEGNRLGTGTGDAFAQMMRKNATLLTLNLATNEILVDGGRYIANSIGKNKAITYLNMADNQLGPKAGLAFARSLKDNHTLAHLDLNTNRLGFRAGTAFAIAMMHNTSLVSINMKNNDYGPNVGKKWATAIQRNVGLTDIDFSNNDLGKISHLGGDPGELGVMLKKALSANRQITSLNLSGCHFDSATFIAVCGAFMSMDALQVLRLDDMMLDEPCTQQLCNAVENAPISQLTLARCMIGDSAKASNLLSNSLGHIQQLVKLDLSGNILGPRCCEKLADAFSNEGMNVVHLNLAGNKLGPEGGQKIAEAFTHLHTLSWLDMSENDLDDDACRELSESLREVISFGVITRPCAMKHFEAKNNNFGDEACSELIHAFSNEITKYIGLSNTQLGPKTGAAIGAGLRQPTIAWEVLDLSGNELGREGANSIWWSMRKNHSLLDLDMTDNKIGPSFGTEEDELGMHGISIDTALERNFTLKNLKMSQNGISARAGVMFAESLTANKSLSNISFSGNSLDHHVGEHLGARLAHDRQIYTLDLSYNYMGWLGGQAIAQSLFTNRFLVELNLTGNKLGENGAKIGMQFARALYENNVVKILRLGSNRFGPASGVSFTTSLKRNKTLTVLDFTDNRLDDEVGEKFLELLNENFALVELGLSRVEVGMRVWDEVEEIMSGRR
ncbi:hypothetical protein TL16_g05422 [Triparma laevis f. inornata]|uniref:Ion transport domain-containing protein n=1 Tax=Triparma laevis f. inornata TaxID=1714386 RepID=A0A9W7E9J4_9STRA|nr:hypothetical protein TL16_g05422 [Triparma laevis f. inornata]